MNALLQPDVGWFLGLSAAIVVGWLAHETAPTRRRNRALREARRNNSRS